MTVLDIPNPNVIFGYQDASRNSGLILLKQKQDPTKFELHIFDDYIMQSMAIVIDIKELGRMYDQLEQYFQMEQIEEQQG